MTPSDDEVLRAMFTAIALYRLAPVAVINGVLLLLDPCRPEARKRILTYVTAKYCNEVAQ